MDGRLLKPVGFLLLFWVTSALSLRQLDKRFTSPFPHMDRLILMDDGASDVWLIAAGFRAVAADVAWMRLLQYTGGGLEQEKDVTQPYGQLKDYTLRVTRIDPYFYRAYLFGSSILAWFRTVERPADALEILKEGIQADPSYWSFSLYASAIVFKTRGDTLRLVNALAIAVTQPDCPANVKVMLANLYKVDHRYSEAYALWESSVGTAGFEQYEARAVDEMRLLQRLMRQAKSS